MDIFLQPVPTKSWRYLEFFENFLEFIANFLEFFEKFLEAYFKQAEYPFFAQGRPKMELKAFYFDHLSYIFTLMTKYGDQ